MVRIELQDVCLGYGRKTVLEGLSFAVSPGEMVGLIGPNGCGKSTIIRALSHIITPLSGRICIDGRTITSIPRRDLARLVGVVPQMPLLPSAFTAFEIVLMGRNPHLGLFQYEGPKELDIAWQAMERTGTGHLAGRRVSELSGGEIQSLLVARVLAQETRAVLLDEPTANLDIGRQLEVLDLIKSLCRENGLTVLAALHDLNLAAQYCDRLILLHGGRIHAEGTPVEVITPEHIAEVYGAENCVYTHPVSGLPCVLLNAGNGRAPRPGAVLKEMEN
jgi:iron complex transport system ATP-binding protein